MTTFNRSTLRRLQQLRQTLSVWEGDRRAVAPDSAVAIETNAGGRGDCILWVDGTEGIVRAMDLVPTEVGPQAVVRTLLRAMEHPHSATSPARPKRIVVRDREIQFFLRGVLQDLNIAVDYEPSLPLIDEIFRALQEQNSNRPPQLPTNYTESLNQVALQIWEDAPWEVLDEEKILSVELNYGDTTTLHISILGMLGREFGILLYRSLESLKKFRERVLAVGDSPESLEQAFLEQDCFFVTFDPISHLLDEEDFEIGETMEIEVQPDFGNLHPLEGMRPALYDDEAAIMLLALTSLHRFFQQKLPALADNPFQLLQGSYRLPDPEDAKKKISTKVSTMPDLAMELFEMASDPILAEDDLELESIAPILRDDLVPKDVFFSLGSLSWDILQFLRVSVRTHQVADTEFPTTADGFPVILIQTSRPKAIALIEGLQAAGGLQAICFNPGEDPFANVQYDLGILQTKNGDLHLFGEFMEGDPIHVQARKKWDQRCKKTKGYCGLVIAKGLKGVNRGNPDLKDMLALFEVRSLSAKELGLGLLELVPQFD
ncbi:MAG: hypothetical protein HC881_18320 [Leptolyngbyaceae cyanobacterium SL_7_1]|nr:hypothetical protein [Leptolyngbyaceae cyanobacterium SL_7_1]